MAQPCEVMQSQRAVEGADAINEKARHRARLATSQSIVSPNLGCADNALVALRRHCFYLAFLIGRAKSIPSCRFSRLLANQASLLPSIYTHKSRHSRACDEHSPGGVHAFFLRVQHQGRRMLGRQQARDSGHSPFRGPARGRSPRARISGSFPSSAAGINPAPSLLVFPVATAPASGAAVA
jgi:hypothetical protein